MAITRAGTGILSNQRTEDDHSADLPPLTDLQEQVNQLALQNVGAASVSDAAQQRRALPIEVWKHVFSFLPLKDLSAVAQVCRNFSSQARAVCVTTLNRKYLPITPFKRSFAAALTLLQAEGHTLTYLDTAGFSADQALQLAALCPNLQQLLIKNSSLTAAHVERLALLKTLKNLRTLDLRGNSIGDAGAEALANAPHLAKLHTLKLRGNSIGATGAIALANSLHLAALHTLDLSWNEIGAAGAQALANSLHLATLQTLILGENHIGDTGARALANAHHLATLHTLDLGRNSIGPAGAEALVAIFGS